MLFWISFTLKMADKIDDAIEHGELAPLFLAIETLAWKSSWGELEYRDALLEHLHARLAVSQRHEAPVERGTHVDLRVAYRSKNWFITIKKGIDNQKRLTLQGQAEDILAHVKDRLEETGIIVVLGLDSAMPGKQETHASSLEQHLAERGVSVDPRGKGVSCYAVRHVLEQATNGGSNPRRSARDATPPVE